MKLQLDRSSPQTLVSQIVDGVSRLVRDAELRPGDRLPPTRTLARELGTTRGTVVSAFEILLANGVLEAHVGRGTFVSRGGATNGTGTGAQASLGAGGQAGTNGQSPNGQGAENGRPGRPAPRNWSASLPLVPLDGGEDRAAARRPRVSAATSRAFWAATLGDRTRIEQQTHDWLGRDTRGTISFAYAIPPAELFPLTEFRRATDKALLVRGRELLQLGPADGFEPLKVEIAARMSDAGSPTEVDDLLITTGSQQSLDLIRRLLVQPGEPVIVEAPTYPGAIHILKEAGARLLEWPVTRDGWDMDALEAMLRERRARFIYVAPDFQNPTGKRMDLSERQRLLDIAAEYGVPVVEDDICGDLRFDDADALPTLRALDTRGLVLYMGSFSKTTFPGIRLGWIAAVAAAREHLVELKQAVDLQTSGPTQAAMYEFARSGALERHVSRVCVEYARRRDAMDAALRKHMPEECSWELPQGGLSLWVRMPDEVDAEEIGRRALDAKVAVSSSRFFFPGRPREQAMRLAFASNPPNLVDEGVKRLATVVKSAIARLESPRATKRGTRTALV